MGVGKLVILPLLLFLGVLTALNFHALNRPYYGNSAASVLGMSGLSWARREDVLKLSLTELAQLFRALGRDPVKLEPRGVFHGEQLNLGVTWLAGAGLITNYGMGICYGACADGQAHLGPWVGKWFDDEDPAAGGNLFQQPGGAATKARPFRVERAHLSQFDGRVATQLHYGAVDLPLLGAMRDEVRCIHEDLCVGFGGLSIAGGVSVSGSPFLLTRSAPSSPKAGGMPQQPQDEL